MSPSPDAKTSLPADVFRRIDKVCEAFEAAWRAGQRPPIGPLLASAEPSDRGPLLRELLLLEIEYRQRAGETPAAEEYLPQFPDDAALVEAVFSANSASGGGQAGITTILHAAKPPGEEFVGEKGPSDTQPLPSLDQFLDSLTGCGLMSRGEVEAFLDAFPPPQRPQDAKRLAEELYRQKKLTKFQVQAVYQGKTHGLVVGNYVVLDKLGQGGMGQVYKAQHRKMERIVALKMLPSSSTKSEDAVRRFQREVKAAARLSHPNIVTAHDADEFRGVHFLVMECVEGKDLSWWVKQKGSFSVRKAVDCVLQAARGLEYAHSQGVVHRDIKPHNLLLDSKGTLKILDMGLARLEEKLVTAEIEEKLATAGTPTDIGLTLSGQVMGTLDYMPPEQALDTKMADRRADIYSLGCTLHYLLVGRPPYGGDTVSQKILAHRKEPIPELVKLRGDVPASLEAIFRQMLSKLPEQRQQTMADVIAALQRCVAREHLSDEMGPAGTAALAETQSYRPDAAVDTTAEHTAGIALDGSLVHQPVDLTERLVAPTAAGVMGGLSILARAKRRQIILGTAIGLLSLLVLWGVIFLLRSSQGRLVVEVNEPGASGGSSTRASDDTGRQAAGGTQAPSPGKLVVQVDQAGALVEVLDEQGKIHSSYRSGAEALTVSLPAAKYRLSVEKDGFQPFSVEVAIDEGKEESITATLEKATAAPAKDEATVETAAPAASSTRAPQPGEEKTAHQTEAPSSPANQADPKADQSTAARTGQTTPMIQVNSRVFRTERKAEAIAFSRNGKLLACLFRMSASRSAIRIWDVATGNRVHEMGITDSSPESLHILFSPNDAAVLVWRSKPANALNKRILPVSLQQWDLATDTIQRVSMPIVNPRLINVSPNGQLFASVGHYAKIDVFELQTGAHQLTIALKKPPDELAFSADGSLLACASNSQTGAVEGILAVWDLKANTNLWTQVVPDRIGPLVFSDDAELLAVEAVETDPRARKGRVVSNWGTSFFDPKTGQEKLNVSEEDRKLMPSVVFCPQGKVFATVSGIWDANTGRRLFTLRVGGWPRCISFSPDGKTLAVGSLHGIDLFALSTILASDTKDSPPAAPGK